MAGGTGRRRAGDRREAAQCCSTVWEVEPVRSRPFGWSVAGRLARLSPSARARLGPPPIDRTVVCHGDPCSPNTLIGDDGRCRGHVDFGELGVADRWADLAVATVSLGWNYPGRRWDAEFFDAYGVDPARRASITAGGRGRPRMRPRAKLGG